MTGDPLRDATRKVAAAARRHLGPHPAPEELIAYTAGELSSADEARLQEHFALCPECTATVLDLASFPKIDLRPGVPGPVEALVPEWERVHERLSTENREQPGEYAGEQAGERAGGPPPWREKLFLALAAGFFLATLGLSYRLHMLERKLMEGELVRADLPLFTLAAEEAGTRGEERLLVSGDHFNLALFLANPGTYQEYSLEAIARRDHADGPVVWRLQELVPTPEGLFLVVGLSRRELPPGHYELRLYGGDSPHRARLAEYPVLIEYN